MGTESAQAAHDKVGQLTAALNILPPDVMLQRILQTARTTIPDSPIAFLLVRDHEELYTLPTENRQPGPFRSIMGFKFTQVRFPIQQTPQLRHALEQRAALTLSCQELPQTFNHLITPEQAESLGRGYGYQHLHFIPLTRPRHTLGFLVLLIPTGEIAPEAHQTLQQLSVLAATMLEIQHLYAQSRSQDRHMAAMHAVSLRVSRSLDLDEVMRQAVTEVTHVLGVDAAGISVIEPASGDLVIRAQRGLHKFAQAPVRIPYGTGVAWDTLMKRTLRVVGSWADEPRLATPEFLEEEVTTTALVPMLTGGEPVGVLSAMSRAPRQFTEGELNLLTNIADQVAVALTNARLHAETRRQSYERAFLFDLATAVAPLQDTGHIAREALHRTLEFLSWPLGAFLIEDPMRGGLVSQAHQGDEPALEALTAQLRAAIAQLESPLEVTVTHAASTPRTSIQIPMLARQRTWGWLVLGTPETVEVSDYIRAVLRTASRHLGVALENVGLYHEMAEREQSTRALYQITRAMTGHNLPAMLEHTLDELYQGISYEIAGVLLPAHPALEFLRLRVEMPPERLAAIEARFCTALDTATLTPPPDADKQRIVIQSAEDGALTSDQLLSYLEAPVMQDDASIGAILLARRRPFHAREQRLLFILAYQLSKVLTTISLFHQAKEQASQLQTINALLEEQEATQIEMFDDIAHELRNPITFMQSYPELLLDGAMGELNADQRQALGVLQQQAQLLSRLVHDLGSMKSIDPESLRCRETDLADLLRKAAEAAQVTARKQGQRLQTQLAADLPPIEVDPDRILQVVGNLLGNAIKFTPEGGAITLTARREGPAIHVAVIDTGPGIPEEERALIFKRLYQGRLGRRYPGMGIGLALSQHIVEAHDGAMGVESQEGKGSTFYFHLPIQKSRPLREVEK